MPRPLNPDVVATAKLWGCGHRNARQILRGKRQKGRTPATRRTAGQPRRVTPPLLRAALRPYYGKGAKPMMPNEQQEIADTFAMSPTTVKRHLNDLLEEDRP